MRMLRAANGAPVSYAALRSAGIEFPAIVASEMELAGIAIERTSAGARLAVPEHAQIEQAPADAREPGAASAPRPVGAVTAGAISLPRADADAAGERPRVRGRPALAALPGTGSRSRRAAWPAPLRRALTAALALAAVAAILVGALGGGGPTTGGRRGHTRIVGALHPATTQPSARSAPPLRSARRVPSVPTALAVQLESRAHNLVAAQRYGAAVPLLRRALAATGEQLGECLQPDGLRCLTYAYALYDLGRALRLSGDPDAAVPVLSKRLEIDNQRATVKTQLALARADVRATGSGRAAA
jgi:tetratricopeptide (TPR) repeat protein